MSAAVAPMACVLVRDGTVHHHRAGYLVDDGICCNGNSDSRRNSCCNNVNNQQQERPRRSASASPITTTATSSPTTGNCNTFGKSNSHSSGCSDCSSAGSSSPKCSRSCSTSKSQSNSSSNNLNCKICSNSNSNSQDHGHSSSSGNNNQMPPNTTTTPAAPQQQQHITNNMSQPPIKVLRSKLVEFQGVSKAAIIDTTPAAGVKGGTTTATLLGDINKQHQRGGGGYGKCHQRVAAVTPASGQPRHHHEHHQHVIVNNNDIHCPEYIVDKATKTTYLKGRFLGKGGFARCYELTDLTTNRVYAGKIIPKNRLSKPYQKDKIVREINLHKQLCHKYVVGFHSYFEDSDNVYIMLENCSKKSLVHVLKCRKRVTEPECRYYMWQLVEGVQYIHAAGIVHRDLKLGNMLLDDHMNVKIADFGLATSIVAGEKKMSVCGTPNYIAPEVLMKLGHGKEVDVWALGCVMYALLVGQPPFETGTLKDTYTRITNNRYSIPQGGAVSRSAAQLITWLLQANPADRPTLAKIRDHEWFTTGPLPATLPPSTCYTQPVTLAPASCDAVAPSSGGGSDHVTRVTARISDVNLHYDTPVKGPVRPAVTPAGTVTTVKKPSVKSVLKKAVPHYLKPSSPAVAKTHALANGDRERGTQAVPPSVTSTLYSTLCHTLDHMKPGGHSSSGLPRPVEERVTWVTKWVDYSNKYGFGFHFSNNCAGVVFNDGSKLVAGAPAGNRVYQYIDVTNKCVTFTDATTPPALSHKLVLLQYFLKYMEENLMEGGSSATDVTPATDSGSAGGANIPYVKTWLRELESEIILMQLSNGTLQINFIRDHSKLVLSCAGGGGGGGKDVRVMCCDQNRQCQTYRLSALLAHNCPQHLREKLHVAKDKLRKLMDMESTQV